MRIHTPLPEAFNPLLQAPLVPRLALSLQCSLSAALLDTKVVHIIQGIIVTVEWNMCIHVSV